jgi:hypothetical protein
MWSGKQHKLWRVVVTPTQKKSFLKYSGAALGIFVLSLLISFGTLAPCGIAKQMIIRQMLEDKNLKENPFMALGLSVVGNAVDSMSPLQCAEGAVRMAFDGKKSVKEEKFQGKEAIPQGGGPDKQPVEAKDAFKEEGVSEEKKAYLDKIDLYDFTAKYRDSYLDGRVPGVNFKVKNKGDRTLSKVEVTVYFKSSDGTVIAEETYYPVLVTKISLDGDNKPLKPNYIWQQEQDHFYAAKNVPSEWKEGAASAKITNIEFQDEKSGSP